MEALKVVKDANLVERANKLGEVFRQRMREIDSELVTDVRGKGLLNAIDIKPWGDGKSAYDICLMLRDNGLLAKQTHVHTIRFAPPLVISKEQIHECCDIIEQTILSVSEHVNA